MSLFNPIKHILIVDDMIDSVEALKTTLESEEYQLTVACNGKDGLQKAINLLPDIILLDIHMNDINGIELCKTLKSKENTKNIPIIFLTAFSDVDLIVEAFDAGGQDYLVKPFNYKELLVRIKTHLHTQDIQKKIEETNIQLKAVNEEYKQLYEIVAEQTGNLEEKNKSLIDSLNYAKIIQKAFLPNLQKLKEAYRNVFIFDKPQKIVSGDFYFFEQVENKLIFAVGDCTGHGIPGAMISILGISLLNQIVKFKQNSDPAFILNTLNNEFLNMLHNAGNQNKVMDGMDIILCSMDIETKILTFSSAKRPLIVIRNKEIIYYKGYIRSIGGFKDEKKIFENKQINLKENDILYLFTDGYTDQFGGENNKKFSMKRFKNLLLKATELSNIKEMKDFFTEEFEIWRNKEEQTDDVLVMSLNISTFI